MNDEGVICFDADMAAFVGIFPLFGVTAVLMADLDGYRRLSG
jgi:hypothetical protein